MKKRRGFTLIELLAVIVILAVIMVIAVPKILKVIENAKLNSAKESALLYIKAVNTTVTLTDIGQGDYKGYTLQDGEYKVDSDELNIVKINGKSPESGNIYIMNRKVISADLCIRSYKIIYENGTVTSISKASSCGSNYEIKESKIYNFDYKGEEDVFEIPENGYYLLELWGAQGGQYNETYHGGYGGYSTGIIYLEKGTKLYINVGGQGKYVESGEISSGGYNGGGDIISTWSDGNEKRQTGGGATSIATQSGLLSTLEDKKDSIIIVAGGGGGSQVNHVIIGSANGIGGSGGGYVGTTGTSSDHAPATGGTQDEGGTAGSNGTNGSFGKGGSASGNCSSGGGGFYGGGSSIRGAGEGSGYINNISLTSKYMMCFNCEESNDKISKTISNSVHSIIPIKDTPKEGNGYVKITALTLEDYKNYNTEISSSDGFKYTGEEEVYEIPKTGTYRLEVWGAQGGQYNETYHGGYGGYSTGIIHLEKGTKLYINVGGQGKNVASDGIALGGYNGGGDIISTWSDGNEKRQTGGGATSIATQSGLLSTLEDKKDSIIIVAGGGGGSQVNHVIIGSANGIGGSGGGYIGTTGTSSDHTPATGGTQDEGGTAGSNGTNGSFGKGGSASGNCSSGGGGFYGGGSSIRGAGGGSGYINNTSLTSKYMMCFNCEDSPDESIKTISTECHNSIATKDCAKEGSGYAKIILVD